EITASAILENHGAAPRFAGSYMVARDITGRRRTEEALHRTNARLEHVVRASPAVIYSRPGPDLPISFISANVVDLLGYSADELLADPDLLTRLMHPDDRARIRHSLGVDERLHQASCEYRLLHRQGGWRWIRDTVRLIC
ncbi:PAS domain-containing protein, partial [Arthrospira platensis SPKY1]|nr:PAS domain-containing protein [Arthrospira platensis SPKY1]